MGEGSVVYFESSEKILGICKLKTLEYRFWRKLREKLKSFSKGNITQTKLLNKYYNECKHLAEEGQFKTNYPLEYYKDVANEACRLLPLCEIDIRKL